jgi:phosphatidylglycerophosphatase A|tara:strand:+ start:389 stop:889 length:501 start_codon:yes stop_codon:yes gene_type:complete
MIKKINLILSTFFGVGYIKFAPGTFASLITSIIFFYLFRFYISIENFIILCLVNILVFAYSLYAIETLENQFEQKDARQIVIDEAIGQSIPIFLIEYITFLQTQSFGADIYLYIASFFLFRFFDILKPFPIRYFDKNYKNSFGILFDDVLAGVYTLVVLLLLINFF